MGSFKIFISYSKEDVFYAKILQKILKPLERSGDISTWFDRDMHAGTTWDNEIKHHLAVADIILFLVSADFLNTDYIWNYEIPKAIERYEIGEAKVIPIILRPCAWEGKFSPFSNFLSLPEKGKSISDFDTEDGAWLKVFKGIQKVIEEMQIKQKGKSDWL